MMDHSLHAASVFDKLAGLYQSRFMDVSAYAEGFGIFLEHLPGMAVLELGCGPGNITRYLLQEQPQLAITGTDLAPNMITLAQQNCPAARFEVLDCREVGRLQQTFDGILIGFCLPYINYQEASQLINDCARLLSPKGCLYISWIEGDYEQSRYRTGSTGDTIYQHYYQLTDISAMLQAAGLQLVYQQRVQVSSEADGDKDWVVVAVK